jgi:hypothetical protein
MTVQKWYGVVVRLGRSADCGSVQLPSQVDGSEAKEGEPAGTSR